MQRYKAEQTQLITNPDTGEKRRVMITQLFEYTPAIWTHRNGDPGEPESYDELGDATVVDIDTGLECLESWVERVIDWASFHEVLLTPINPE